MNTPRRRPAAVAFRPARVALLLVLVAGCTDQDPEAVANAPRVTEIAAPAGPGSAEPSLFRADDGRIVLSWLEPADSGHALRFATLGGDGWTDPRTVARGGDWFVNWADFPSVVVLPDGRMAAHYLQRGKDGGYDYGIRIVQSSDGGESWSDPVVPHRDGVPAEHGFVSMFPVGDSLGAIWLDGRKSDPRYGGTQEMTLRYTTLAANGSLGREVTLDERICDCCQTSVALTSRGPVAVYRNRDENEIRDIYVTRFGEGAWSEGVPVHDDGWEIPACPVNGPSISADGERVAVAWFTGARDTARVRVAFSSDGGRSFGPATRVDDGDPAGRVDVELLDDGSALVSWIERTGGEAAEVRARRLAPHGEAGPPITIAESSGARASGFPRMARSAEGVVLAWTEPGDPSRVRTARVVISAGGSDR